MTDYECEYVDTRRAARLTGLSPATLATLRVRGRGPRYHRPGGTRRVVYRVADLHEWMGAPLASTSDAGPAPDRAA